ncbi:unnamed protein product [Adineta ricciae]|uniref:Uncharacterized protein n=1 Tax=Adineta ricciae TaxID=249248 RepID=A0A815U3Z1_ADIRI|nr:unnamed protein product [Adineta ricciae]
MNEETPRFHVEPDQFFSSFTFTELSEQNITGEDLYFWSSPIDLIERYELYLISNDKTMGKEIYYNCTLPRFGRKCQYEFDQYALDYTLQEYMRRFYRSQLIISFRANLTCYIHLQCHRGPYPSCLDWTEICNGINDCLDYPFDEEYCSQVNVNDSLYQLRTSIRGSFSWLNIAPLIGYEDTKCNNGPLTSSCSPGRNTHLLEARYSIKDNSTSDNCWLALKCLFQIPDSICKYFCSLNECIEIIEDKCPLMFYFPTIPILFSNIYFAYEKTDMKTFLNDQFPNSYICYENNSFYDNYFRNQTMISFENKKCYRYNNSSPVPVAGPSFLNYMDLIFNTFYSSNQLLNSIPSLYRIKTTVRKSLESVVIKTSNTLPPCLDDDRPPTMESGIHLTHDGEYFYEYHYVDESSRCEKKLYITFQSICDGINNLSPKLIDERNQTDETDCDSWPCNNLYTHCDGFWNCLNGEDEIGCQQSLSINCSSNEHLCVSSRTKQFICLNINKTNDGQIDCLGAIDEPSICQRNNRYVIENLYCTQNNSKTCLDGNELCWEWINFQSDVKCQEFDFLSYDGLSLSEEDILRQRRLILCQHLMVKREEFRKYFSLKETNALPINTLISTEKSFQPLSFFQLQGLCHRGLPLRIWLNKNKSQIICLCPHSYYGSTCQYQNQRVSLNIKFAVLLSDNQQIPFEIIIYLIENNYQRIIHSSQQFVFLFMRDCELETFNNYLLYAKRSKNHTENYSIHIDIYEKSSSIYRGSFFFPIINSFLPVHRLNLALYIPLSPDKIQYCSQKHQCLHGKCIKYLNFDQDINFCQCDPGWSGQYCTIQYLINCTCSLNTECLGIDARNRSICLCPLDKSGPRCLIRNRICEKNDNSTCHNHGLCIPSDLYKKTTNPFQCICSKGYSGQYCQKKDNEIHLFFETKFTSPTIFIHFIETTKDILPRTTTIWKTISLRDNSISFNWSHPFNVILIEDPKKNYYLINVQKDYIESQNFVKQVKFSDRCRHINELFNQTVLKYSPLQRMKHYHIPCQTSLFDLLCFYDNIHICFCYEYYGQRLTNCFRFNHTMNFDCPGRNECQNNGKCFQIGRECVKTTICLCESCFYGKRCKFTTSGFSLSLDNILAYHIQPTDKITKQSNIIKIIILLNIVFLFAGLINGICSLITFQNAKLREVGCGLYLLYSSMTTLIIIILFGLKFWIFIFSQTSSITNRLFLHIQCISLDYLLRIFLHMDQWLNACVACERAVTIMKGTRFNQRKSRQTAKLIMILLLIFNILLFIPEPFHRHLDEEFDEEENTRRIWCVVTYSVSLQTYITIINTLQFFIPFIINFISAIIFITKKSAQQSHVQKKRNFREILRENYREHKNLFISPVILVFLAVPRLVLTYVSKCMQSTNDSWLFLSGYFISFIPAMLTFVIFVLPSKFYKEEFHKTILRYRTAIQQYAHISK